MTPKEKAIELVDKFIDYVNCWDNDGANYTQAYNYAKQCALIAVDEILKIADPDNFMCKSYTGDFYSDEEYFIQVKKEIEKL